MTIITAIGRMSNVLPRKKATLIRDQSIRVATAAEIIPGDLLLFSPDDSIRNYGLACKAGIVCDAIPVTGVMP